MIPPTSMPRQRMEYLERKLREATRHLGAFVEPSKPGTCCHGYVITGERARAEREAREWYLRERKNERSGSTG